MLTVKLERIGTNQPIDGTLHLPYPPVVGDWIIDLENKLWLVHIRRWEKGNLILLVEEA